MVFAHTEAEYIAEGKDDLYLHIMPLRHGSQQRYTRYRVLVYQLTIFFQFLPAPTFFRSILVQLNWCR